MGPYACASCFSRIETRRPKRAAVIWRRSFRGVGYLSLLVPGCRIAGRGKREGPPAFLFAP